MLRPSDLNGTSVDDLAAEIDRRYLRSDERGHPKGFTQLAAAAQRFLAQPSLLGLKRIKKIYPILVVEDDDLPCKPLVRYVLEEAKQILRPLGGLVEDPLVLHVEDVAMLAERCRRYGVPYMLKRLWRDGFSGIACRDLILERLPVTAEERLEFFRAFPLTDPFFDETAASACDLPTILCQTCGEFEKVYTSNSGYLVSRCARCSDSSERVLSSEVVEADREANVRWIAAYLDS